MRKKMMIFAAALTACLAAQAQSWRSAMEDYNYSLAIRLLDMKLDSLKAGLSTIEDSAAAAGQARKIKELLLNKASCQKNLYKFNDAITTLDDALQTGGEDAATFAGIAECHRIQGNDFAASIFYENAVRMAPENLFLRIQKMMLQYKMEKYAQCAVEGKEILRADTIPSILITIGNSFNKMNLADSALAYYGKAYRINPNDFRTLEKISKIHLGRGKHDTVLKLAENYLERDSTNNVIIPIKGLAQYGVKDYRGAFHTFRKSLEYGCDQLSGYWYLGLCKLMEKDYWEAAGWFKKAAALDSTDVNLVYYQGFCFANYPGRYQQRAEEFFTRAVAMMQPDSSMMYKINSSRADMYRMCDGHEKVVEYLLAAQRYGELSPTQIFSLGFAYRLLGDYKNALKQYERYFEKGKEGSSTWEFVEEEIDFIKEEQFMKGEL